MELPDRYQKNKIQLSFKRPSYALEILSDNADSNILVQLKAALGVTPGLVSALFDEISPNDSIVVTGSVGSSDLSINVVSETSKIEKLKGIAPKTQYEEVSIGRFISFPYGKYDIGEKNNVYRVKMDSFSIMDGPVVQKYYAQEMGINPSKLRDAKDCPDSFEIIEVNGVRIPICPDHPVETVSYDDAVKFAERLSELDPKYFYRLPTEAQLLVTLRRTACVTGRDDEAGLGDNVYYKANYDDQTHPLKSQCSNAQDIYSVREWTRDLSVDENVTSRRNQGLRPLWVRVLRGGWDNIAKHYRSTFRRGERPEVRVGDIGFRLVRTLKVSLHERSCH